MLAVAMLDMVDMDMVVVSLPILMVTLPTEDMARGPLMLSLKLRLMLRLMLLFFMDHMDMLDVDMLD